MVALNVKLTNVSKCQIEEIWWHLNAKLTNGSKCRTKNMMALNSKLTNGPECLTVNDSSERQTKGTNLSAKLNNGSECQIKNTTLNVKLKQTMTLNAKMKMWL